MFTKEAIEEAANKFADAYPRLHKEDIAAYNGFEAGVEWALRQTQPEQFEHQKQAFLNSDIRKTTKGTK